MQLIQNLPISIKFVVEKSKNKTKNVYLVFVRVLYKRQRALISLKMEAAAEDWDFSNNKFTTGKKYNLLRNNLLSRTEDRLIQIYLELKRTGSVISAKVIKNIYNGDYSQSSDIKFIDFYKKRLSEIREKTNEYTLGAINHYVKTQTHLERFLNLNGLEQIKMSELSRKFLERFEHYLLSTPNEQSGRPVNANTSATYIRKVKATVNAAYRMEVISSNPFVGFKIHPFKAANKTVLTQEEFELLRNHSLGNNLSLDKVRKTFIFCCVTGLRHSDAVQLHENMIRRDNEGILWITLRQQKTSDVVEIPMSSIAEGIYNEFEAHRKSTGLVLPMLTNQRVNASLKVIAELTGIHKRLSFHCSRHSFATLSLEQGVDIAAVSSLMGHRTIKTTQVYGKVTRKRKADIIKFLNQRSIGTDQTGPSS